MAAGVLSGVFALDSTDDNQSITIIPGLPILSLRGEARVAGVVGALQKVTGLQLSVNGLEAFQHFNKRDPSQQCGKTEPRGGTAMGKCPMLEASS